MNAGYIKDLQAINDKLLHYFLLRKVRFLTMETSKTPHQAPD